jgi:hypothetical protein
MQDIYRAGKAKAIGLSSSILGHKCTFRRNSPVYTWLQQTYALQGLTGCTCFGAGVSNFTVEHLTELVSHPDTQIVPAVNQACQAPRSRGQFDN